MGNVRRSGFILALAAFGILDGCASAPTLPHAQSSPLLDGALPRVSGATLSGQRLDGNALADRIVVVKFFADYCAPCKRTLPAAERLSREHRDVTFVGVSEDEYASTARSLAERYGLTFDVVHDASGALRGRFRVSELPITFLADRKGIVRWVGGPEQSEDDLARAIEAVQ
jgi:cytochrome c biogenesis protein CcmG/thiol:disulfide interchange protein DsbE